MKTRYSSYCLNNITKGCKYCVKGEKLVLFISGKCSGNCWYCSLSGKRKNIDKIWANERPINNVKDLIEEIKQSRATSCGITGGDPLLFMNRTLKYARIMKKKFKNFHIHIYLPTKLVTKEKLEKLEKYVDEVRLHPEFLINKNSVNSDLEKIKLAGKIFNRNNTGIELPMIPEKKKEIFDFILKVKNYIGFVNINEFELSETNYDIVTRKYKLKEGGYVISGSKEAGLWILNKLKKTKLNIHLCTAELKNNFQFKNRLLRYKIEKYGRRTRDGTVIYLKHNNKIISEKQARKLLGKKKVYRVEEFPTWDKMIVEEEEL